MTPGQTSRIWQTIREIGNDVALDAAVEDAFPGAQIEISVAADRFELLMHQPGLLRPLSQAELSDGTLRYLLLMVALLTPRPPPLMVLNEPETSLHPDLLPPLGRLMGKYAEENQLFPASSPGGVRASCGVSTAKQGHWVCSTVRVGLLRGCGMYPFQ